MTRILWHSVMPQGTGYGSQTGIWCKYLKARGHDVAISACHGLRGIPMEWEGITVYPPPWEGPGDMLLRAHAREHKAELIITLYDLWTMDPRQTENWPTLAWLASDTARLGMGDRAYLEVSGAIPVAISEHTARSLEEAGFPGPLVIPHGIDTERFSPPVDRFPARFALGIGEDTFAIGINANNIDRVRKGFPEQIAAFARFHAKHPDSRLFIHTVADLSSLGSLNLPMVVEDYGLTGVVMFCNQYTMLTGGYDEADMASWYAAMDVVSNTSYGEGFGLVAVEAQACGTPVILSDGTTGRQLCGPGWTVRTQDYWNPRHNARWHAPLIDSIVKTYEKAYARRADTRLRRACRLFAEQYSVEAVGPLWDKAIAGVAG